MGVKFQTCWYNGPEVLLIGTLACSQDWLYLACCQLLRNRPPPFHNKIKPPTLYVQTSAKKHFKNPRAICLQKTNWFSRIQSVRVFFSLSQIHQETQSIPYVIVEYTVDCWNTKPNIEEELHAFQEQSLNQTKYWRTTCFTGTGFNSNQMLFCQGTLGS